MKALIIAAFKISGEKLDMNYLKQWAKKLKVIGFINQH